MCRTLAPSTKVPSTDVPTYAFLIPPPRQKRYGNPIYSIRVCHCRTETSSIVSPSTAMPTYANGDAIAWSTQCYSELCMQAGPVIKPNLTTAFFFPDRCAISDSDSRAQSGPLSCSIKSANCSLPVAHHCIAHYTCSSHCVSHDTCSSHSVAQ
jgi:hypothetical protein